MILVSREGGILRLTLNRADKANALTGQMLHDLYDALVQADDTDLRALILTGAGRVFSAGADLDQAQTGLATDPIWDQVSNRIADLPCLTIAALNGTLAGGAMGMALACDVRISVPEARFFYPVMRRGYLPQPADPARMCGLIGSARTRMILLAGAQIEAAEALSWGLVDRIVPADRLLDQAQALAEDASMAPLGHLAAIKRMIPRA